MTFNDIAKVTDQKSMKRKKKSKEKKTKQAVHLQLQWNEKWPKCNWPNDFWLDFFLSVDFDNLLNAIDLESLETNGNDTDPEV